MGESRNVELHDQPAPIPPGCRDVWRPGCHAEPDHRFKGECGSPNQGAHAARLARLERRAGRGASRRQKGFFADEGIDLEIVPGGPNIDGVAGVASGQAAVGQTSSSPSVMLARSAGIPIKAIAAGYQKHPFTYFSLKKNPIRTPQDMIGKTIATQPTAYILLRALLAKNNIPEDKVKIVNMGSDMNQLMTGQVDAVTGWLTNTNALKVLGDDRVDMMLWDTGIQLYANVYFTRRQANSPTRPTCWRPSSAAPRAAGAMPRTIRKRRSICWSRPIPILDKASEMEAVHPVLGFSFNDTTKAEGWGAMTADNWADQIKTYAELKQFKGTVPKVDDVMTLTSSTPPKKRA